MDASDILPIVLTRFQQHKLIFQYKHCHALYLFSLFMFSVFCQYFIACVTSLLFVLVLFIHNGEDINLFNFNIDFNNASEQQAQ